MYHDTADESPDDSPADRYAAVEFAECVVVYDPESPCGWLQSDAAVPLADAR